MRAAGRIPLLLLSAIALLGPIPGCGRIMGDPLRDRTAAAMFGVRLRLSINEAVRDGRGRLWLRLMSEDHGEAMEARLDFRVTERGVAEFAENSALGVSDAALVRLRPGRYRLASFCLSGRLEPPDGPPLEFSLLGAFENTSFVVVKDGELCDLGLLDLVVAQDRSFLFEVRDEGAGARVASARKHDEETAELSPVRRVITRAERGTTVLQPPKGA